MQTIALSESATRLLRRHLSGEMAVDDANRDAHRELARAGLMVAGHSFVGGRKSFYRFTEAGWVFANATWPGEWDFAILLMHRL